jgi:hypothetical protein
MEQMQTFKTIIAWSQIHFASRKQASDSVQKRSIFFQKQAGEGSS